MDIAILFWAYKDLPVCRDRMRHLRSLNPRSRIFVLFGGALGDAAAFEDALSPWADDFYAFPHERPGDWKWRHGDLVLAAWFRERGASLAWDSVFVAQWDLLTLVGIDRLLRRLRPDQLLLPGLRQIREVERWWHWVREDSPERAEYLRFLEVHPATQRLAEPLCCQFLAAALPYGFLQRYASIDEPECGFLEYKLPMLAQTWGFGFFRSRQFRTMWREERSGLDLDHSRWDRLRFTFHADKSAVSKKAVALHARIPYGRRVFHPFVERYPA